MKFITTLFICGFLFTKLSAQILSPTAEFKFDGSLNETYSAISPDSSAANFIYGSDEIGATNSALEIASGSFIIPDPQFTRFGLGDFSISFWLKLNASLWPAEDLMSKSNSDGYFKVRYNGFFDQISFVFRPSSDSSEFVVGTSSQSVGSTWNMYTITADRDGDMKMYQNNNLVFTKDISTMASFSFDLLGGNLRFGTRDISLNNLLFFDKAITPEEVSSVFNNELSLDAISQQDIIIYPNPASKVLKIKSDHLLNEAYSIYATYGELVQEGNIENNQIEILDLRAGSYILSILNKRFPVIIR